jgi:hypothetical protein
MKLTPIIDVQRFISIDGTTIVRIAQYRQALDGWYSPPVIKDLREVWGTCLDENRDSFREVGSLQEVLRSIASPDMVTAAVTASPRRFAEMVAVAHDVGLVFYVASRAMWAVADRIADAKRFCLIQIEEQSLRFHTLLPTLFGEPRDSPGVYRVSFSLSDFAIQSRDLVEEYPKPSQTRPES